MKTIRYFVKQEYIFNVEGEDVVTIEEAKHFIDSNSEGYCSEHTIEVIQIEDENGELIEEEEI